MTEIDACISIYPKLVAAACPALLARPGATLPEVSQNGHSLEGGNGRRLGRQATYNWGELEVASWRLGVLPVSGH